MIKLLLVEDDTNLSYIVHSGLQEIIGGYEVITAFNGKEGLEAWREHHPDIIISDIDMPVMDGFEMVRLIRETDGDTPILFASALTSPKDVRKGYDIGVNNYVKKPFIPDELDAHLHAILKMKEGTKSRDESGICRFGKYVLDAKQAFLLNNESGNKTTLTVREAQLLQLLAQNKGEVVNRETILNRFWNTDDDYFASRSLDVFITKLRKLFANDPQIDIVTKGYSVNVLKIYDGI
ncbi:response regulator transcription factor [Phocaeicola coprocola]|uniref:response regulator transcription factor n=1 Tax=Phocaeicola coprocola TaxID=310298 RepID=UPI0032C08050